MQPGDMSPQHHPYLFVCGRISVSPTPFPRPCQLIHPLEEGRYRIVLLRIFSGAETLARDSLVASNPHVCFVLEGWGALALDRKRGPVFVHLHLHARSDLSSSHLTFPLAEHQCALLYTPGPWPDTDM